MDESLKIAEFCKLEKISPYSFYKIPEDIRPRVTIIPGTAIQIITAAERAAYHVRLAEWQLKNAAKLETERKQRSDYFSMLGKRAVQSPKHPCRQHKAKKRRSA